MNKEKLDLHKTLYITDLDGTLLKSDKSVSKYTIEMLNALIEKGIHFSVATARTPATVVEMLEGVKLNVPIVVMNGAAIYDIQKSKYLDVQYIKEETVQEIYKVIEKHQKNAFVHCIVENRLLVYYDTLTSGQEKDFYEERKNKRLKTFKQQKRPKTHGIGHFVLIDSKEVINSVYEDIKTIPHVYSVNYPDVYDTGAYYLEIYSDTVSKSHAIERLKAMYHFEELISFGDNINDIPMFEISDECYAVANAKDTLKEIATSVIGTNEEDGVIKQILHLFNKKAHKAHKAKKS